MIVVDMWADAVPAGIRRDRERTAWANVLDIESHPLEPFLDPRSFRLFGDSLIHAQDPFQTRRHRVTSML
jgi:hypothetical protein